MKKIKQITIKHIPDYDADLSWLGKFSDEKGEFAVKHNGGHNTLPYFNAENVENMKQARQNYNQIMKYDSGDLYAIGIKAEAEVYTSQDGKTWKIDHITSAGLWGIEMGNKGDNEDIKSIEEDELDDLKITLKEFGFTDKEINNAPVVTSDK